MFKIAQFMFIVHFALNFFKGFFVILAEAPPKIIGLIRQKIEAETASVVETLHAVFMLPTLLRH